MWESEFGCVCGLTGRKNWKINKKRGELFGRKEWRRGGGG